MVIIRLPINDNDMPVKTDRDYPVNQKVSWHGGIHLDIISKNIYSIMDGHVCYARDSSKNINTAPLNYRGATHDGCVLLRHSLSLKIASSNSPRITFYSLYMHLSKVDPLILKLQGNQVKQGTLLGQSGMVDGSSGMHFQICCSFANLRTLVGRDTSKLNLSKNGRTDVAYGDTHYYVPAGTSISKYYYNNGISYYAPAYQTIEPYYIIVNDKKTKMLTEKDGNYPLVKEFKTSYSSHMLYLEYLGQAAYLDTTDVKIKKYSDADFPHWLGWSLINDDGDQNSQCNSATVLSWLNSKTLSKTQIDHHKKMSICNFPFEWVGDSIKTRFDWLRTNPPHGMKPFTDADMKKLEEHIKALCFYEKLPTIDQKSLRLRVWHFDPRAFINHLNKSNTLSLPVIIYKTKRQMNDYKAPDMLYGDLTKEKILALYTSTVKKGLMLASMGSSESNLWLNFKILTEAVSWGQYAPLIRQMVERMKNNTGGKFTHHLMNKALAEHSTTKNSLSKIKEIISGVLRKNNGKLYITDLNYIKERISQTKLPKFDDYDWFNGLGIIIHDTWSTHITLHSLIVNDKKFKATISYLIQDHFGLDNDDINSKHFENLAGFRAWFLLQRWDKYGYKPFINEMTTTQTVEGTF